MNIFLVIILCAFLTSILVSAIILLIALAVHAVQLQSYEAKFAPGTPIKDIRAAQKEAFIIRRRIIRRFMQLGYRYKDDNEPYIKFGRAVVTPERLYYKIAVGRLPDSLRLSEMISLPNLQEVGIAIERQTHAYLTPQSGAWLVVCRRGYEDTPESFLPWQDAEKDKREPSHELERTSPGYTEEFNFDEPAHLMEQAG